MPLHATAIDHADTYLEHRAVNGLVTRMNKNRMKAGALAVFVIAVVALAAILMRAWSAQHRAAVTAEHLEKCEMLVWSNYDGMGGGGNKLVLWRDGRSEVWVYPSEPKTRLYTLTANPGWETLPDETGDSSRVQGVQAFLKRDVFQAEDAVRRFREALAAGIHFLKRVEPDYLDGGGVKVGVRKMNGELRETNVAHHSESFRGENRRIFDAVSAIMNTFDRDAYTQKKPVSLPLSAVDVTTWEDDEGSHGPAIGKAYEKHKGELIEVVGFRLDPHSFMTPQEALGRPNGLGSSPDIGVVHPVRTGHDFFVPLTGSVPPKHGAKYAVTGKIKAVNNTGALGIEVQAWRRLQ